MNLPRRLHKIWFTSTLTNGIESFYTESMKPFQLKRNFEKEHANYTD